VESTSKIASISEILCIGCGLCIKRCPFHAIKIINLPKDLSKHVTYRYGPNTFKLHRLPVPRIGQVLGLVGTNGIGKSTALKIMGGFLMPNFGDFEKTPEWSTILKRFRGSELQSFFTKLIEENLAPIIKPQYVDAVPNMVKGKVSEVIKKANENGRLDEMLVTLELNSVLDRDISELSGGELQRFITAVTCLKNAQIFMFDEPSSYLDVKQRMRSARMIRSTATSNSYVIAVEHDLSILDYLSDYVCVLYGDPGIYGVITMPFSVREGINMFLAGFISTENLRFRDFSLTFKISETQEDFKEDSKVSHYKYPAMKKTLGKFELNVNEGSFSSSQLVVLVGENGTGKTTFIRMLAGQIKPDDDIVMPELFVSYKPQKIAPKFEGTVQDILNAKVAKVWNSPHFMTEVTRPLQIEPLLDQKVKTLSGGELQRLAMMLVLGKPADIYLIDEPSAYLDSEQRLIVARIIKRFIMNAKKTAFVVEHDFIMASYLADRVIVFEGQPSVKCKAHTPEGLISGMNKFLKILDITFRRDPENYRPRINKWQSVLDREQKSAGNYFSVEFSE
jgi:ATP-binding cassette subfamily E protein 1